MTDLASYVASINAQFDARVAFEIDADAENLSIQATLAAQRKSMTHEKIAATMLACNVDVAFINRQERKDSRYNVKSITKVENIARFLVKVERLNHYTLAILKSAIALTENDMTMTHDDAFSACSADLKAKNASKRKHISHYSNVVATSTANTQSSSSINALQMYHILIETRDAANNTAYIFNKEHKNAEQIKEMLAA